MLAASFLLCYTTDFFCSCLALFPYSLVNLKYVLKIKIKFQLQFSFLFKTMLPSVGVSTCVMLLQIVILVIHSRSFIYLEINDLLRTRTTYPVLFCFCFFTVVQKHLLPSSTAGFWFEIRSFCSIGVICSVLFSCQLSGKTLHHCTELNPDKMSITACTHSYILATLQDIQWKITPCIVLCWCGITDRNNNGNQPYVMHPYSDAHCNGIVHFMEMFLCAMRYITYFNAFRLCEEKEVVVNQLLDLPIVKINMSKISCHPPSVLERQHRPQITFAPTCLGKKKKKKKENRGWLLMEAFRVITHKDLLPSRSRFISWQQSHEKK